MIALWKSHEVYSIEESSGCVFNRERERELLYGARSNDETVLREKLNGKQRQSQIGPKTVAQHEEKRNQIICINLCSHELTKF